MKQVLVRVEGNLLVVNSGRKSVGKLKQDDVVLLSNYKVGKVIEFYPETENLLDTDLSIICKNKYKKKKSIIFDDIVLSKISGMELDEYIYDILDYSPKSDFVLWSRTYRLFIANMNKIIIEISNTEPPTYDKNANYLLFKYKNEDGESDVICIKASMVNHDLTRYMVVSNETNDIVIKTTGHNTYYEKGETVCLYDKDSMSFHTVKGYYHSDYNDTICPNYSKNILPVRILQQDISPLIYTSELPDNVSFIVKTPDDYKICSSLAEFLNLIIDNKDLKNYRANVILNYPKSTLLENELYPFQMSIIKSYEHGKQIIGSKPKENIFVFSIDNDQNDLKLSRDNTIWKRIEIYV